MNRGVTQCSIPQPLLQTLQYVVNNSEHIWTTNSVRNITDTYQDSQLTFVRNTYRFCKPCRFFIPLIFVDKPQLNVFISGCVNQETGWLFLSKELIIGTYLYFGADRHLKNALPQLTPSEAQCGLCSHWHYTRLSLNCYIMSQPYQRHTFVIYKKLSHIKSLQRNDLIQDYKAYLH
jgi:hypothetical protein